MLLWRPRNKWRIILKLSWTERVWASVHDNKLQSSVKGRKYDWVIVRFSKRALAHRVVTEVLSPSVITILNLVKCLSNCSYHSPHWKLELFFFLLSIHQTIHSLLCTVLYYHLFLHKCVFIFVCPCLSIVFHLASFS